MANPFPGDLAPERSGSVSPLAQRVGWATEQAATLVEPPVSVPPCLVGAVCAPRRGIERANLEAAQTDGTTLAGSATRGMTLPGGPSSASDTTTIETDAMDQLIRATRATPAVLDLTEGTRQTGPQLWMAGLSRLRRTRTARTGRRSRSGEIRQARLGALRTQERDRRHRPKRANACSTR
jgi:hypothetical protein